MSGAMPNVPNVPNLPNGPSVPSLSTGRPRLEVVRDEQLVRDDEAVQDLIASLRLRFPDLDERQLTLLVTAALDELGPVRVTSFLPILVERHIRERFGREPRRVASH